MGGGGDGVGFRWLIGMNFGTETGKTSKKRMFRKEGRGGCCGIGRIGREGGWSGLWNLRRRGL